MKRVTVLGTIVATVVLLAVGLLPASAAPSGTKVQHVYQLPCAGAVCDPDTDDTLTEAAIVKSGVQAHVASSSSVGLSWVRLEVGYGTSEDWVCLHHWTASSATSFSEFYDWDTAEFPGAAGDPPGACPESGSHGDPTRNGLYQFRVVAKETVTDQIQESPSFDIKVNNRPDEPSWAAAPVVAGTDREPVVELRWRANLEPDIVEYHYVRVDPNGEEFEFAVSASKPGGQGCERNGDVYTCYDDFFAAAGFAGTYTYALVAYRASPSPADSCALPGGGSCVQSRTSGERTARLEEPPPPPTDTASPAVSPTADGGSSSGSGSGSGSSGGSSGGGNGVSPRRSGGGQRADYSEFYSGTYSKTLPYGNRRVLVPGTENEPPVIAGGEPLAADDLPEEDDDSRRLLLSVAAGLAMLMTALHLGRLLRDR